ncbi:ABC transporter ATP-binding protein [Microbacterium chocolatum]|uniref:ABC transporter ATP-binding protein n=1 Tax=Microbacterium aurantiacum TaxID=162393 RepID=UPI00338E4202
MTRRAAAGEATDLNVRPAVQIAGLSKEFRRQDGSTVRAIDDVNLDVEQGEFVVLLGPSGCGKTTLLRTIAGLEQPDRGRIDIGGVTRYSSERNVAQPPEKRGISMIFQSYALWPHMSVFKNVAYPLQSRSRRLSRTQIKERVEGALTQVGIPELSAQYPSQLSGGQQQRVALARALVSQDELILFDEPLSNVDAKVREHLRIELASMQRALGFTAIFVTHDQTEAMELASRIAVVDRGRVAQFGTPHEIYHRPASRYVAKFIGAINEIEGRVIEAEGGRVVVDTPHGRVVSTQPAPGLAVGDEAVALWRPERGHADAIEPDRVNRWRATVETAMFVGSHTEFALRTGDLEARLWSPRAESITAGEQIWVSAEPSDVLVLPREDSTGVQTAEV